MAQSSLRQFYTVRKRPQEEHGSVKRRKLTEESRLDIPMVGKGADPLSLPFNQPLKVSTTASSRSQDKTSSNVTGTPRRLTTRSKSRGRTKAANTRPRCKAPPPKQATPTLSSSTTAADKTPLERRAHVNKPTSTRVTEGDPKVSSHSEASSGREGDGCTRDCGKGRSSSPTHEEDPLLPSSPKTPKRASSPLQPSPTAKPPSSSLSISTPPARSRQNLADRMKLASQTSSLITHSPTSRRPLISSTHVKLLHSGKSPANSVRNLSAKELAQRTVPENKALEKRTSDVDSSSGTDIVSRLYRLSARELTQHTEPEQRLRTRESRRTKGKAPVTPTSRAPQLHQFKSFVVESPTKSPSKQPAYQRYHSLAQSSGVSAPDLPLPYKYQVLSEKFRCTDTVVTMLQKRREICTFNKLKQAVGEMTRRKYENRNLAQMETVYPKSYIFRQEKNIPGVYDRKTYESYQLTVECNVCEDGSEKGEGEEMKADKSNAILNSSALLRRRKVFNKNLGEITRRHHKKFLSSLNPPLEIPDEKILRWHPAFQLDTVPDVEEAELPKPPLTESYTTARDVLNVAQEWLAPRVQQALESVAGSSEGRTAERAKEERGGSVTDAQINPALRGVSMKLLEKIQQKEASRVRSTITRDPAKEKRLEMLARLPDLCRIVRSFFVTEKKAAIPWDSVVQKLSESHASSLPPDRIEEHLEFMQECLGGWLNVVKVRKRRFIKISKNTDTHILTACMETVRKKLLA